MQPMLSGVAVRGRFWHAAHALAVARDKSALSSLWRKNQVDSYGEPRNSGRTFFDIAVVGTKTDSCASKSGLNMWCFNQFTYVYFKMWFAPDWRALFRPRNFQECFFWSF